MIVSKFGGTSVGTYEAMKRSAKIVASNQNRQLIVISATSGTTNDLVALSSSQLDSTTREKLLRSIEQRHLSIVEKSKEPEILRDAFYTEFSKLREHLDYVGRDKLWKDRLYSFGEMMSTRLFVEVLKEEGVMAEWLDAREIIKTDSTFGNANPVLDSIKKESREVSSKR
jgi:aspartate kinase